MDKEKLKKWSFYIIPLVLLLFIFLSFYPGIFTYDGDFQWAQVKSGYMNTAHPFLSTYFQYLLSYFWNDNSVILIFQIFVLSFVWGTICNELYNKKNYKTIAIYSVVFILCPIISLYAITTWKDILYSYYLLSLVYFIYIGIKNKFKYNKLQYFLIGLLLFLVFNYRVNGMIVSVLLLIFFFIVTFVNRSKNNFKLGYIALITFVLLNCLLIIPKNYHVNRYNNKYKEETEKVGVSSLDAYVVWMMGAHINKGYITKEDQEFLNKCINYESWKTEYSPFLMNGVFLIEDRDDQFQVDHIKELRSMFMKYSLHHPFTIIEHYIKADALLWSPVPVGYVYHYDFKFWEKNYSFEVYDTSKIKWFNKLYEKFTTLTLRRPIRVWFYQPAFMLYLSLIVCYILVKALDNKKLWFLTFPMLANIASLLPINIAQDLRYVYINYLTAAFLILLLCINFKNVKKYFKKRHK